MTFSLKSLSPLQFTDLETQSTWNIKGKAIAGPLQGKSLTQIPAYNAFWFAWKIFWPQTAVLGE